MSLGTDAPQKSRLCALGEWREPKEISRETAGFSPLLDLYSPWQTIAEAAQEFVGCQTVCSHSARLSSTPFLAESWDMTKQPGRKSLMNTCLPEENPAGVMARKTAPNGIGIITAGVDVQDDRLCYEIVGWGQRWRKS
jgi:phage terminase large subunit GpA-like protein